jgi:hypothetical protein
MHRKQPLAAADVIQRPPSVTVALNEATVGRIDQFIRNFGTEKGISSRSDAIQFFLDEAMPRYCQPAAPDTTQPAGTSAGGSFARPKPASSIGG